MLPEESQTRVYLRSRVLFVVPLCVIPAIAIAQSPQPPQPGQTASPPNPLQLPHSQSAPPLTVGEKFDYRVIETFGFRGLLGAAVGAAIGQGLDTPGAWGEGVAGYATRFASGYGGTITRQGMAFVMDTAFHEDSRYFPSEDKSFKARTVNALKQTIICKTDSGHPELAYSRLISAFANAQLVNAWQPKGNDSVGDGIKRGGIQLGSDLAMNLLQEFIPFTRPRSLRNRH